MADITIEHGICPTISAELHNFSLILKLEPFECDRSGTVAVLESLRDIFRGEEPPPCLLVSKLLSDLRLKMSGTNTPMHPVCIDESEILRIWHQCLQLEECRTSNNWPAKKPVSSTDSNNKNIEQLSTSSPIPSPGKFSRLRTCHIAANNRYFEIILATGTSPLDILGSPEIENSQGGSFFSSSANCPRPTVSSLVGGEGGMTAELLFVAGGTSLPSTPAKTRRSNLQLLHDSIFIRSDGLSCGLASNQNRESCSDLTNLYGGGAAVPSSIGRSIQSFVTPVGGAEDEKMEWLWNNPVVETAVTILRDMESKECSGAIVESNKKKQMSFGGVNVPIGMTITAFKEQQQKIIIQNFINYQKQNFPVRTLGIALPYAHEILVRSSQVRSVARSVDLAAMAAGSSRCFDTLAMQLESRIKEDALFTRGIICAQRLHAENIRKQREITKHDVAGDLEKIKNEVGDDQSPPPSLGTEMNLQVGDFVTTCHVVKTKIGKQLGLNVQNYLIMTNNSNSSTLSRRKQLNDSGTYNNYANQAGCPSSSQNSCNSSSSDPSLPLICFHCVTSGFDSPRMVTSNSSNNMSSSSQEAIGLENLIFAADGRSGRLRDRCTVGIDPGRSNGLAGGLDTLLIPLWWSEENRHSSHVPQLEKRLSRATNVAAILSDALMKLTRNTLEEETGVDSGELMLWKVGGGVNAGRLRTIVLLCPPIENSMEEMIFIQMFGAVFGSCQLMMEGGD